jgi:hypothetical protein
LNPSSQPGPLATRSASASIRKYLANDFTGFWLIDKQSNQLEGAILDFPGGKGFLADIPARAVSDREAEKMRTRTAEIWSHQDIDKLRPEVLERLKAESIAAMAVAPWAPRMDRLVLCPWGASGPTTLDKKTSTFCPKSARRFPSRWTMRSRMDDSAPREIAWKTSA